MMSAALFMTVLVYSAFSFAITSIAVGMMMILFVACIMRLFGLAAGLSNSCLAFLSGLFRIRGMPFGAGRARRVAADGLGDCWRHLSGARYLS